MIKKICMTVGILFCILLVMLFIPQISFPILIQLDQILTQPHDTIIDTTGGHKFFFKEDYLAGFPEDHFIYKIYEIKNGKRLLITDTIYLEDRIDKNLAYKYYSYQYDNQIVAVYYIRGGGDGDFLIYKWGDNGRFVLNNLKGVVSNAENEKYLTPFFRKLLAKCSKDDIPIDVIEYLLKVRDVESYKSIKLLCESIKDSSDVYDTWMNKYISEIEKGNGER